MLSKVSKTFRSFVVGPEETEKGSAVTRKRQRDEYVTGFLVVSFKMPKAYVTVFPYYRCRPAVVV